MEVIPVDETKRETDDDAITKRLNKVFESRLDLDRVRLKFACQKNKLLLNFA